MLNIAYLSPFPPKPTGIALYSHELVAELRKIMCVHCLDHSNESAGDLTETFGDFERTGHLRDLVSYDAVIYHLGNNPHFHLDIFRILRQWPGIVVLHDVVLYYLFAGLGRSGLLKYLLVCEGSSGVKSLEEITGDSPLGDILRYQEPENHPLTAAIFPYATSIVVHNAAAKNHVETLGYAGPIHVIPLLRYSQTVSASADERRAVRKRWKLRPDALVIGCFGFIGRTKRIPIVCSALAMLKGKLNFQLLIVGTGDNVVGDLERENLMSETVVTAFVTDAEFDQLLGVTDILVNLRFPSMGESSATLVQALSRGIACIVTDDASFSELPDGAVVKIRPDDREIESIVAAIERLSNQEYRAAVGGAARLYSNQLSPSPIAHHYQRAIASDVAHRAQEAMIHRAGTNDGETYIAEMMNSTLARSLPKHLGKSR